MGEASVTPADSKTKQGALSARYGGGIGAYSSGYGPPLVKDKSFLHAHSSYLNGFQNHTTPNSHHGHQVAASSVTSPQSMANDVNAKHYHHTNPEHHDHFRHSVHHSAMRKDPGSSPATRTYSGRFSYAPSVKMNSLKIPQLPLVTTGSEAGQEYGLASPLNRIPHPPVSQVTPYPGEERLSPTSKKGMDIGGLSPTSTRSLAHSLSLPSISSPIGSTGHSVRLPTPPRSQPQRIGHRAVARSVVLSDPQDASREQLWLQMQEQQRKQEELQRAIQRQQARQIQQQQKQLKEQQAQQAQLMAMVQQLLNKNQSDRSASDPSGSSDAPPPLSKKDLAQIESKLKQHQENTVRREEHEREVEEEDRRHQEEMDKLTRELGDQEEEDRLAREREILLQQHREEEARLRELVEIRRREREEEDRRHQEEMERLSRELEEEEYRERQEHFDNEERLLLIQQHREEEERLRQLIERRRREREEDDMRHQEEMERLALELQEEEEREELAFEANTERAYLLEQHRREEEDLRTLVEKRRKEREEEDKRHQEEMEKLARELEAEEMQDREVHDQDAELLLLLHEHKAKTRMLRQQIQARLRSRSDTQHRVEMEAFVEHMTSPLPASRSAGYEI